MDSDSADSKESLSDMDEEGDSSSDESASDSHSDNEELKNQLGELSNVPFGELAEMKNRVGTKLFQKSFNVDKDSRNQAEKIFHPKPLEKGAPLEMSSKMRPRLSAFKRGGLNRRDPRFDALSGEFNETLFDKNYSFVYDIEKREYETVKKTLKKCKSPEKRNELQKLMNKMDNRRKARDERKLVKEVENEIMNKEVEKIKEGKRPYYMKKSEKKKLIMAKKFQQLKKRPGTVDKFLAKKSRRALAREKKNMPRKRDTT